MAQVIGGSDFDFVWDDKTKTALRLLSEAADLWARGGRDALEHGTALAVFLTVLAWPQRGLWWQPQWPLRFFDAPPRNELPAPADSCRALAPTCSCEDVDKAIRNLECSWREAADMWSLGDPETPQARAVLQSMLEILWEKGIAPRPPGRQYLSRM